jgi:hypothetical protein
MQLFLPPINLSINKTRVVCVQNPRLLCLQTILIAPMVPVAAPDIEHQLPKPDFEGSIPIPLSWALLLVLGMWVEARV